MKSRFVVFTALAAVLLLSAGAGCSKKLYPPEFVSLPDTFWPNVGLVTHLVSVAQTFDSAHYIVDWGDGFDTTEASFGPDDTAYVQHVWSDTGRYEVRTRTLTAGARRRLSVWSAPKTVQVIPYIPNSRPVIDSFDLGPWPQVNVPCTLVVFAHDPDGDSLAVEAEFGSGDTMTGLLPSPCTVRVTHVFTRPGTAMVVIRTFDMHGTVSKPETADVQVSNPGGLIWYWWSNDPENHEKPLTTSPAVANDGEDEVVLGGCKGDYHFYSIRASNGHAKKSQTTKETKAAFTGHPGFANGHIIVGSDEGEIYALALLNNLKVDWQYPDSAAERGTYVEWGAPAFSGYNFYVGHDDDSIFKFTDNGVAGTRVAGYGLHASVVDAPIVDATGNVIFGTDSAYLYKMDGNLSSVIWRVRLLGFGEVYGPILGSDGTIYCATDSSRLYAIDPTDGSVKTGWPVTLNGDVSRPALGQSALFVASGFGKAYSINPATGTINWERSLTTTDGFYTTPVVAANGYVYFQSDADKLYCVNQADGTVIWTCNCPNYLPRTGGGRPHRPRKTQLVWYSPNPSITSTGDIIVVGADACYCVDGHAGPLDPAAAWPKWQKNLYNSGK